VDETNKTVPPKKGSRRSGHAGHQSAEKAEPVVDSETVQAPIAESGIAESEPLESAALGPEPTEQSQGAEPDEPAAEEPAAEDAPTPEPAAEDAPTGSSPEPVEAVLVDEQVASASSGQHEHAPAGGNVSTFHGANQGTPSDVGGGAMSPPVLRRLLPALGAGVVAFLFIALARRRRRN
jgi:hypothetical protein